MFCFSRPTFEFTQVKLLIGRLLVLEVSAIAAFVPVFLTFSLFSIFKTYLVHIAHPLNQQKFSLFLFF